MRRGACGDGKDGTAMTDKERERIIETMCRMSDHVIAGSPSGVPCGILPEYAPLPTETRAHLLRQRGITPIRSKRRKK